MVVQVIDDIGRSELYNFRVGFPQVELYRMADGNDTVYAGAGDDSVYGGVGNDLLYLDGGNDLASGGKGSDQIFGGAGNDSILGNNGDDFLYGGLGSDSLYGGDGNDVLRAGVPQNSWFDVLDGGAGNDRLIVTDRSHLYGGAGKDVFVFNADGSNSEIHDFQQGLDKIDLTALRAAGMHDFDVSVYLHKTTVFAENNAGALFILSLESPVVLQDSDFIF